MRKEKETKKNHERGRHKAIQYQSVALTGTKCRRIQYLPSGTGRPTSTKRGFRPGTNSIFLAVSLVSAQLIDILKYGQFDQILPTHPLTSYGPYNSTNHALNCGQNYCANQLWARTDLHQHCWLMSIVKHPELPAEDCSTFRWMGGTSLYGVYLLMLA